MNIRLFLIELECNSIQFASIYHVIAIERRLSVNHYIGNNKLLNTYEKIGNIDYD